VLSKDKPKKEGADRFSYDPENAVPTVGGAMIGALNVAGMRPGPFDQGAIESRSDVLIYNTAPFAADSEISGPVTLRLFASTSAVDTDFTAKLALVESNGKSFNLCEGLLRLSGRNFTGKAEPAEPGKIYQFVIGVGQTSIVIAKGQRLRLQVSSSNFPQYDRNMNTGHAIGVDGKGVIAQQAIYHDANRASYLEVPIAKA
jgi:putative CocE/NonD family hydrolase